jgi:hypothetical protein
VPIHRAGERDEQAVAVWRKRTWPTVKGIARRLGAWICFADEAGQTLQTSQGPHLGPARTHPGRFGHRKGSGRICLAALTCYKPGQKARLICRMMTHRGRKGEKNGFREPDFAALLDAAHQQLGGPIVLVWDSLGGHTSALLRRLLATRTWLRVYQLPSYAPELNPVDSVWFHLNRSLATLAAGTITQHLDLVLLVLLSTGSALIGDLVTFAGGLGGRGVLTRWFVRR